jgi:hypothetical protein
VPITLDVVPIDAVETFAGTPLETGFDEGCKQTKPSYVQPPFTDSPRGSTQQ